MATKLTAQPNQNAEDRRTAPAGYDINPRSVYTASECMTILGVSRATLTRYMEQREFPLKPIGTGRAIGQDILDWLKSQKPEVRGGGYGNRKRPGAAKRIRNHPSGSVKAHNHEPPVSGDGST